MNSFYSEKELADLGLKGYGMNVLISRKCSLYGCENILIGNNVRIDDFCILSGSILIGNYVHISAYSALYGSCGIQISDFSGLSPRCTLLSASDDFSGEFMISPMVPNELTNVRGSPIIIDKYVQIGSGSIIMPGVKCNEGAVAGAMSFVNRDMDQWSIYFGIPAKKIKERKKKVIDLALTIESRKELH